MILCNTYYDIITLQFTRPHEMLQIASPFNLNLPYHIITLKFTRPYEILQIASPYNVNLPLNLFRVLDNWIYLENGVKIVEEVLFTF